MFNAGTLRLSALAPLGLARYKTRAPLARRLRASALKNELPFLGLATKYRRRQEDGNGLRRAKHKPTVGISPPFERPIDGHA